MSQLSAKKCRVKTLAYRVIHKLLKVALPVFGKLSTQTVISLALLSWSSQAQVVTVLGNQSMPFNGVTEVSTNGSPTATPEGMTFEILNAARKYGAPEFKFEFGLPLNRAQHLVKTAGDKLVAIVPLTRTLEREQAYTWIAALFKHQPRFSFIQRTEPLHFENIPNLNVGGNNQLGINTPFEATQCHQSGAKHHSTH